MQKNQAAVVLILSVVAVLLLVFALPKLFSRFSSTEEEAPPVKKTYWFTGVTNKENKDEDEEEEDEHKDDEEGEEDKEDEHKEEQDKEEDKGGDVVVVANDASKYKIATVSLACILAIVIVVALVRVKHLKNEWTSQVDYVNAEILQCEAAVRALRVEKDNVAGTLDFKVTFDAEKNKVAMVQAHGIQEMNNEALKWKAKHPGGHIYECMHSIWPENIVFNTEIHKDVRQRDKDKEKHTDPKKPQPANRYEIENIDNAIFLRARKQHTDQFEDPPANNATTWLANPLNYKKLGSGEEASVFVDQRAVSMMCASFARLPKDFVVNMVTADEFKLIMEKEGGDKWSPDSFTNRAAKDRGNQAPDKVGDLSHYRALQAKDAAVLAGKGTALQTWLKVLPLQFPTVPAPKPTPAPAPTGAAYYASLIQQRGPDLN
jgi:hypothetical protein